MELNMMVKGRGMIVVACNGLEKRLKGAIMVAPNKDLVQVDLEGPQDEPTEAKSVSLSLLNCLIYWDRS